MQIGVLITKITKENKSSPIICQT